MTTSSDRNLEGEIIENLPQSVAVFDLDGRLLFCNESFAEQWRGLGLDVKRPGNLIADLINQTVVFSEPTLAAFLNAWKQDPASYFRKLLQDMREDRDRSVQIEVGKKVISIVETRLSGDRWMTTQEDITERVVAQRQVEFLASHDSLTGLPNRRAFNARLEDILAEARITQSQFGLLMVDVDRLKQANDRLGHLKGDELLMQIGLRLRAAVGVSYCARLSGDEFCVICESGEQPDATLAAAGQVLAATNGDFWLDGHSFAAGVSIGGAIFPGDGANAEELMTNADAALYRAKADGKGVARFHDPTLDLKKRERGLLERYPRLAASA